MKSARRLMRHAFDAVVLALALVAQIDIWAVPVPGPRTALVPLVALSTLPLLLRRRVPFAAPVCVFAGLAALAFVHREAVSSQDALALVMLLAFAALGAHPDARQCVAGMGIAFASLALVAERDPRIEAVDVLGVAIAGTALAAAVFALQQRVRHAAALEERAARLLREHEQRERAVVADERRRIARDLHHVIAHGVEAMTVQAGAARRLLDGEPSRARASLLAVEETGREALAELRRLLGILRREEAGPALRPQPGLGDLEGLVAQTRRSGLPVELSVEGAPPSLPPGVELTAYRFVQDGLAEARERAGPARARVAVRYGSEALELEVSDEGRAGGARPGLVGMRERVALYGGDLAAGTRDGGGYAVRARLPVRNGGASASQPPAPDPAPAGGPDGEPERGAPLRRRSGDREPERGTPLRSRLARNAFDTLVIGLAVVSEIEIWVADLPGPRLVLVPGVLVYTLPLLLRHRLPFAAPALAFAVQAAIGFSADAVGSEWTGLVALLLTFWVAGAHNDARNAVAAALLGIASLVVIVQLDERFGTGNLIDGVVMGGGIWLIAVAFRRRGRRAAELDEQAGRLERERGERERAAVAEERRRIARDLHDVVAHSVGVMTVQAGAARLLLEQEPERARAPLEAVEETGLQALGELNRLLGMLPGGLAALGPRPGLGDLDGLVAQARGAGLPVELSVHGAPVRLAPGVDLAAYRVVQEGLTNSRKHAGPARARVAVGYGREALELEISDDGRAHGKPGDGGGHGLVGMRERVALYGGELEAAARPGGGFSVRARLPLEAGRP